MNYYKLYDEAPEGQGYCVLIISNHSIQRTTQGLLFHVHWILKLNESYKKWKYLSNNVYYVPPLKIKVYSTFDQLITENFVDLL